MFYPTPKSFTGETKTLRFVAEGPFALFSMPAFDLERMTYDCMTPTAARGIVQSILWKPAVEVDIQRIDVCNPIRHDVMTVNGVDRKVKRPTNKHFSGQLDASDLIIDATKHRIQMRQTMLLDVRYVVHFQYLLTDRAGPNDNIHKFEEMFNKRLAAGKRFRLPCLGLQHMVANCREVGENDVPLDLNTYLGGMPHYRIYEESSVETVWFSAQLKRGSLYVPPRTGRKRLWEQKAAG